MKNIHIYLLSILLLSFGHTNAQEYQTKEINGMTMAYQLMGEGEPLVLLHGFTMAGVL